MTVYIVEQRDLNTRVVKAYAYAHSLAECRRMIRVEEIWQDLSNSYFAIWKQDAGAKSKKCIELIFDEEIVEEI